MPTLQWSEPRAVYPTAGQGGFTDLNLYLMDASGTTCLAASNAVQANGVGDTIEQFIYENTTGVAQPVKLVVDVQGTSTARKAPILDLRWRALSAGVQTIDPPERAGSMNPDSNYLGFATSAGAVNASLSVDPATIALEPYSAAGPTQILSTTRCPGGKPGPCKGVPGGSSRSFPAPYWAAADGVSVSGAGGFGSGTCPTTRPRRLPLLRYVGLRAYRGRCRGPDAAGVRRPVGAGRTEPDPRAPGCRPIRTWLRSGCPERALTVRSGCLPQAPGAAFRSSSGPIKHEFSSRSDGPCRSRPERMSA